MADNKELIPEFYFGDGSFLLNKFDAKLGTNHIGENVNHVGLPDWTTQNGVEKNASFFVS